MAIYFDILGWIVGFTILTILLFVLRKRKHSSPYLFFFSIFWIYILFVLKWTLFPIYIDSFRREVLGRQFMASVNLIPFYFGPYMTLAYALPGLILNTILTMPAGFGISFITRIKPKDLIWLIVAFGFGIDGLQLLISLLLGYPYRTIDANDVICNSLGVLLGYVVFRLFAWMYVSITQKLKFRHKGLPLYVYEVSNQNSREVIH